MKILLPMLTLVFLMSCQTFTTIEINQSLKTKLESYGIDITKVQFFNSSDILLRRPISNEEMKSANGKITSVNNKFFEEILIKKDTPCILVSATDDELVVQFESGDDKKLHFVKTKKNNDCYKLNIDEIATTGLVNNQIIYGSNKYTLGSSTECYLAIKQSTVTNEKKNRKIIHGLNL